MKPKNLKVTTERNFSAHHMLIGAARQALNDAKTKRPGCFYCEVTAMTMAALSIEAMCNAIGDRAIPEWKDFESASPMAKLRLLCENLNLEFDKLKEPWASARWLYKFRNSIAHAKPEPIREEKILLEDEFSKRNSAFPKSKLEKEVSLDNATRALGAVEKIKETLCLKLAPDISLGLYCDASFGHASAHEDQE